MFAEKLKVVLKYLLMLFILVNAGFLSALTAMRFAIRGQVVTVPRVGGLRPAEGKQRLANRKLLLKVEARVYNDSVPEDVIVSQDPPAETQVKARSRVDVIVSLGKRKVPIPDLVRGTLRAARINLTRRGLALGLVATVYDPQSENDNVIAQEPPANSKEVLGPSVNLLLSRGPSDEAFIVPDFIGMDYRKAGEIVVAGGLEQGGVVAQPYPDVPSGVVIAQQPPAGSKVFRGATISFTVSK